MPTGCEAVLMKLCHWDLHKKFSPNDILTPDGQMQTDLKHMNTCELKLSELTGNCFTYNNLAARSSACWCKYWQNHKQELSLQTGMTWLGQQTKLDKPIPLRGTLDILNTLKGHESWITWGTSWVHTVGFIFQWLAKFNERSAQQIIAQLPTAAAA